MEVKFQAPSGRTWVPDKELNNSAGRIAESRQDPLGDCVNKREENEYSCSFASPAYSVAKEEREDRGLLSACSRA